MSEKNKSLGRHNFPTSVAEFRARRVVKTSRTLNDLVEDLVTVMIENDEFRELVDGADNKESVNGTVQDDSTIAATMVKAKAKDAGAAYSLVEEQLLSVLRRSIQVALRRHGLGRRQLRQIAQAEAV